MWAGTFSLSLLTFGDTIAVANRSLMYRETFKLAAQGGASTRSLRHRALCARARGTRQA